MLGPTGGVGKSFRRSGRNEEGPARLGGGGRPFELGGLAGRRCRSSTQLLLQPPSTEVRSHRVGIWSLLP